MGQKEWMPIFYNNGGDKFSDYFPDDFDKVLTKREIEEELQELRRQREEYERANKVFMSEERRKALAE